MSRSKGLREGSEANRSPRNGPCGPAADICDSLAFKQQRGYAWAGTSHNARRLSVVLSRRVRPVGSVAARLRPVLS
jgi:hypothetical protein